MARWWHDVLISASTLPDGDQTMISVRAPRLGPGAMLVLVVGHQTYGGLAGCPALPTTWPVVVVLVMVGTVGWILDHVMIPRRAGGESLS